MREHGNEVLFIVAGSVRRPSRCKVRDASTNFVHLIQRLQRARDDAAPRIAQFIEALAPALIRIVASPVSRPLCPHEVGESFARLFFDFLISHLQSNHPINAKTAKSVARFAPCGKRPVFAPEVQRQGPHPSFA